MSGNTFGELFRVTTFGESHGAALGCIIDGCPAGIKADEEFLQHEMDRRKPGTKGAAVTARNESDKAEILRRKNYRNTDCSSHKKFKPAFI